MTATTTAYRSPRPFGALGAFVAIETRRALRNRRYLMFAIGFPVAFYLLYTGVLSGAAADPSADVGGLPWRTFFMISMATYAAIGAALGGAIVIAQERDSGWTRQLRVTPLPPMAYVSGKLAVASIVTVPAIAAVLIAGATVAHVALPAGTWVQVLVSLAIGALPFVTLGLLIGYLFDTNSAQGAMMVTFFGLAILGGLWAPLSMFPDNLATIGRMLPSFRLADIGRDAAQGLAPNVTDLAFLLGYALVMGCLVMWRYRASELRASG
jgi:ABC-2 type transport system permease protein